MVTDPMPGQTAEQYDEAIIERLNKRLENEPNLYFLESLFQKLPELELYLVGGMVRDTIIQHKTAKDYDFVARGVSIARLIDTLKTLGNVTFNGKNFGVLDFWPKADHIAEDKRLKQSIQIAFPRQEFAKDTGGYRDVTTLSDENMPLENDLGRRDLTMNAIAYNIREKKLIDPYHGQEDLRNNIIRTVGSPEKRFQEDYTRILRAIRFACRFNAEIDPATWQAIQNLMPRLNDQREVKIVDQLQRKIDMSTRETEKAELEEKLASQIAKDPNELVMEFVTSREKIGEEILKSFKENPVRALDLLDQSGALKLLLPEITRLKSCEQPPDLHAEGDVFQHTRLMLEKINSPECKAFFPAYKPSGEFAFAVLFHDIGKPDMQTMPARVNDRIRFNGHDVRGAEMISELKERFKLTNRTIEMMKFLAREHMFLMSAPNVNVMGANKIAERFIDSPFGEELLMLFYLDCVGTVRPDGSSPMENFHATVKRILEIRKFREQQPTKILDGGKIKTILNLKKPEHLFLTTLAQRLISEFANRGQINDAEAAEAFLEKNKHLFETYKQQIDAAFTAIAAQYAGEPVLTKKLGIALRAAQEQATRDLIGDHDELLATLIAQSTL